MTVKFHYPKFFRTATTLAIWCLGAVWLLLLLFGMGEVAGNSAADNVWCATLGELESPTCTGTLDEVPRTDTACPILYRTNNPHFSLSWRPKNSVRNRLSNFRLPVALPPEQLNFPPVELILRAISPEIPGETLLTSALLKKVLPVRAGPGIWG